VALFWGNKGRIAAILFLVAILNIFNVLSINAETIEDIENLQKQLQKEINQTKSQLENGKEKEKDVLKELKTLDNDIERLSSDITNMTSKINNVTEQISIKQEEIENKEIELDQRSEIFSKRLKQIYINGDINFLEIIFASTSIADFLTRFEFLKRIAENDLRLYEDLEIERAELEKIELALENEKKRLEELNETRSNRREKLQISSSRQSSLLRNIKNNNYELAKGLSDMEKESDRLARELMSKTSKGTFRGTLLWPTPGYYRITSPYGYRIHPILKKRTFHSGVDIAAPMGAKIIAAAKGKVIFTGWSGAYGNTIVVDHGGITTRYSHLSSILVKEEQFVQQGEQIGKVGSTGWSTGPHIDFGVRINGENTDPLKYLRK